MQKRYFLIPLTIILIIAVIWACKYGGSSSVGLDFNSLLNKRGEFKDGLIGYNGQITYGDNKRINPNPDSAVVVFPFQDGPAYYRIPSLVVTTNGTLLAFADRRYNNRNDLPNRIEVEVKRSTDNGRTWSKRIRVTPRSVSDSDGHGDVATVVVRKTGTILALAVSGAGFIATAAGQTLVSSPNTPQKTILFKSDDDGKTWSEGEDITSQIYGAQCKVASRKGWYAAFVSSGNGLQLSTGRIIFVLNVRENSSTAISSFKNYALYSDDGGKTWQVSKNAPVNSAGGNESKIVELTDGTLLMSTRPNSGNKRFHSYSKDEGETWTQVVASDITAAGSNGDMIYYTSVKNGWDTNRIIHFIPTSKITVVGGQYNGRQGPANPHFYYSYTDDGSNFIKSQAIKAGQQSGYSSLAVLHDGSIGVLYEDESWGGPIKFMKVNFEWLTKGKDKGPEKVSN